MTDRRSRSTAEIFEVPLLGLGRHAHPRRGGCLMELVGAVAGGPWTDHPLCTPPVLAQVARTVNDKSSTQTRPLLATLIPYLISEYDELRGVHADIAVSLAVLDAASGAVPAGLTSDLTRQLDRVAADSAHRRWAARHRRRQLVTKTNVVLRAIEEAVDSHQRDETLRRTLIDAINARRSTENLGPVAAAPLTAPEAAGTITVLTRWTRPLGADWHELEVTADPTAVPRWLADAWQEMPDARRAAGVQVGGRSLADAGRGRSRPSVVLQ
jgi:hypothetical protein